MSRLLPLVLVLGSCWSSSQPQPKPAPGAISVDVASVSLADNCPDPVVAAAPPANPVPSAPSPGSMHSSQEGEAIPGSKPSFESRSRQEVCEQTRMQLSIKSEGAGAIQIKRVELLDKSGKSVGVLAARNPTLWTNDTYVPWNQQVAAGQQLTASYSLTAPNWEALGGRDPSATYRVRVTVSVGGEERTVDKAATVMIDAPALPEPPGVVT